MKDMFNSVIDKIKSTKFFEMVSKWTSGFAMSSIKAKLDNYVDEYKDVVEPTAIHTICYKIANWASALITKAENSKISKVLDVLIRIICSVLSIGFVALTVYVMCKLFYAILMVTIIVSAVALGSEIIALVLNKAFTGTCKNNG